MAMPLPGGSLAPARPGEIDVRGSFDLIRRRLIVRPLGVGTKPSASPSTLGRREQGRVATSVGVGSSTSDQEAVVMPWPVRIGLS
jgi:hypothetical protein